MYLLHFNIIVQNAPDIILAVFAYEAYPCDSISVPRVYDKENQTNAC